jgi:serine protease Do
MKEIWKYFLFRMVSLRSIVSGTVQNIFVLNGKVVLLTTETPYSNELKAQSIQIFDPATDKGL